MPDEKVLPVQSIVCFTVKKEIVHIFCTSCSWRAPGLQELLSCLALQARGFIASFFIFLNSGLIEGFPSGKSLVEYVFEAHLAFP